MIATDSNAKRVTTGSFSRQAEDPAPDLGVILVDGENFQGIFGELEAYEVFVDHFEEIRLKTGDASDGMMSDDAGFFNRFRS